MSEQLEAQRRLVTLWILRGSIGLCVGLLGLGLLLFVIRGGEQVPATPAGSLPAILMLVWQRAQELHPGAFLDAGLLVLLFTPLARLAAGVIANARAKDGTYVLIGLVVIVLVMTGLLSGQTGS